jgi:NAD(P)-dependent dehydrogenase (short-subunit alcohol dehydrogenase family)
MSDERGVCVVAGVGPGNGTALVRKFAHEGYRVAMLARKEERLRRLEEEIPLAKGYPTDITDADRVGEVIEQIRVDLGPVDILVHNAAAGAFNAFMDVKPETLEMTFRTNMMSLLLLGQAVVPHMLERGGGSIIVTGNTSARRGKANFAAFAPTKAGQRILAESMARSLGPQGIHVAYVIIDAVIDLPWTRKMNPDKPDDFFIQPADIADSVHHLTQQKRSGWTFELDLRPYGETW